MARTISTDKAPRANGPYSQAIVANKFLFVSGQIPIDPITGKIEQTDIRGQARQVLENLKAVVEAEGLTLNNVVKANVMITDMNYFPAVNEIYGEYFTGSDLPTRVVTAVVALPKQSLIEIDAIAAC